MSVRHGSWGARVNTSHPVERAFLNAVWGGDEKDRKKHGEKNEKEKKGSKAELWKCDLRTLLKAQGCAFEPCTAAARLSFKQMRINEYGRHVCRTDPELARRFGGWWWAGGWVAGRGGELQIVLQSSWCACSLHSSLFWCVCVCVFKCNINSPWCSVDW